MKYGTLRDVAELLQIKPDTAWRWARAGYLPTIRLGRNTGGRRRRHALRFNLDKVRQWVEGQADTGRTKQVPQIEAGR